MSGLRPSVDKTGNWPPCVDPRPGRSAVPHVLRSTFHEWAAERTQYPRGASEIERDGDDADEPQQRDGGAGRRCRGPVAAIRAAGFREMNALERIAAALTVASALLGAVIVGATIWHFLG
jgi:hypothetical protein